MVVFDSFIIVLLLSFYFIEPQSHSIPTRDPERSFRDVVVHTWQTDSRTDGEFATNPFAETAVDASTPRSRSVDKRLPWPRVVWKSNF